jgi:hypothetical protein
MGPDESLDDLNALRRVIGRPIDSDALLELAIVEGGGVTLDSDIERSPASTGGWPPSYASCSASAS